MSDFRRDLPERTPTRLPRGLLQGADLRDASLRGADLSSRNLSRADLTGADLTGADLTGAILKGAILTGAVAQRAKLLQVDAADATMDRTDFSHALLINVNVSRASLREAQFSHAVLQRVTFDHTDLSGADLRRVRLVQFSWNDCIVKCTRFPPEWIEQPGTWFSTELHSAIRLIIDHAEQNQDAELWNVVRFLKARAEYGASRSPEIRSVCLDAVSRIENALNAGKDLPIPAAAPPCAVHQLPHASFPPEPAVEPLPIPAPGEFP